VIGGAKVVGIGESARRVEQFYFARRRIIEALITKMKFTAIAFETGLVEAMRLNDYVLGRAEEPASWQDWFTLGFGDEKELQLLLRWLRQYNVDARHTQKVQVYGIDVMVPYSSPSAALDKAFEYLDVVDPAFKANVVRTDLMSLVGKFLGSGGTQKNMDVSIRKYMNLPIEDKDKYTARVADLISIIETNRSEYVGRSSPNAYDWAHRAAISAKHLDSTYRAATADPELSKTSAGRTLAFFGVRDRAMFDNLQWILQREGPQGRVAVWAHNAHVAKGAIPSTRGDLIGVWERGPRLGQFLEAAIGPNYVAIGSAYSEGKPGWQSERKPAECGTVDQQLASLSRSAFLLDLRSASGTPAQRWLNSVHVMRADNPQVDFRVKPASAWDAIVFFKQITPVITTP